MKKVLFIIVYVFLTFNLFSQNEHYVVVLEGTGTWCGACPRGIIILEEFSTNDSMFFIPICVHEPVSSTPGDPMEPEGLPYSTSNYYFNAFPSFMFEGIDDVNAGPSVEDGVQNLTTAFNQRRAMHPPLSVAVSSEYNENTRETSIYVSTELSENLSGDYRFNVVIVEDSVTGTTPEYDQTNYYAKFPHVARKFFGEKSGIESSLPENLISGETYNYDLSYTVPDNYNVNKITIVAWVSSTDGRIINANYQDLIHKTTNINNYNNDNQISIYPNPAKDFITISSKSIIINKVEINDISGKLIKQINVNNNKYVINSTYLKKGIYFVKIISKDSIISKKLIIE